MVATEARDLLSCSRIRTLSTVLARRASLDRSTRAVPLSIVTAFRDSWVPSGNDETTAPFSQSAGPASRALAMRVLVEERARNQRSSGTRKR